MYSIEKNDIDRVGRVLADAFQDDPIWNKLFADVSDIENKYRAFFEVPVRYGMKYGESFAVSENLEGIASLVPGKYAPMSMWRLLRSGAMGAAFRMGANTAKMMATVFRQIEEDRNEYLGKHDFLYLQVIGVASEHQGKGFGRQMIDECKEHARQKGVHLYLETETEKNVAMYEYFGFRLLKKVNLPVIDLPMWEMAIEP